MIRETLEKIEALADLVGDTHIGAIAHQALKELDVDVDIEGLCDVIRQILIGHNLHNMINDEDECGYSLTDALTMDGQTVDKGYEEIHLIVDALFHPIKDHLNQRGLLTQPKHIEGLEEALINFGTPLWDLQDGVFIMEAAKAYLAISAKGGDK